MRTFIFACIIYSSLQPLCSQEVNVNINKGFATGNTQMIKPHLASGVDFRSPLDAGKFSSETTSNKLEAFFNSYRVRDYLPKHSGKSPSGSTYSIGVLLTQNGKFRIYLLLDNSNDNRITEIRIEVDE